MSVYVVTGSDNKNYGPVDLATLQQWVRAGSVIRETPVFDTSTGHRVTAGQIVPLQPLFPAPAPAPAGAYGREMGLPAYIQAGPAKPAAPRSRSTVLPAVALGVVLCIAGLLKLATSQATALLSRSSVPRAVALRQDVPLVAPSHAHARGPIYFLPIGRTSLTVVHSLADYYHARLGVEVAELPPMQLPDFARIEETKQIATEDTISLMRQHYRQEGASCVIGIIDQDINSRIPGSRFNFSTGWGDDNSSFALISTARLDPAFFGDPSDPALATSRLQKLATKMVGLLYYGLPPSKDPESPVSAQMNSLDSMDRRHQGF